MNPANGHSQNLKRQIKTIPLVGPAIEKVARLPIFASLRGRAFPGSASFWESRYREGGNSGAGSYGRLAQFKAEVLNEFVRTNEVRTVIEFGCGDGAQLDLVAYPEYVGVDVASVSIEGCRARFASDSTKHFYLAGGVPIPQRPFDLALSLDVVFHLVEDGVFDSYMRTLFKASERHVVVYSSNYDARTDAPHVRHRKFTAWIEEHAREWQPAGFLPNRYPFDPARPEETSFADFHFFERRPR